LLKRGIKRILSQSLLHMPLLNKFYNIELS
jgi:hypothetical protein